MGRLHLFELEDFPWFPSLIRDAGTAYIRFMGERIGAPEAFAPLLARVLRTTGERRLVDLCSGGGGPTPRVVEVLGQDGLEVTATLTDFHPNVPDLEATASAAPERLSFDRTPVDATRVPSRLAGARTLFNAFHHFRPEQAERILRDAVETGQPVAIFESVNRRPAALLGMLLQPLAVLLVLPFLRPFRWQWLPLTYVLPVIPLFVAWDGFVSCLRVYSPDELRALVARIDAPGWTWEIGEIPLRGAPIPGTYLLGYPAAADRLTRVA